MDEVTGENTPLNLVGPENDSKVSGAGASTQNTSRRRRSSRRSGRKRWLRVTLWSLVVLLVLIIVTGVAGIFLIQHELDSKITRVSNVFPKKEDRVIETKNEQVNILVLGSDSRITNGNPENWSQGGQRSDTMMIVQITSGRDGINVMSIPRDSWVDIPGHGMGKINWALSFGGPSLAIQTVEQLTQIHIDHFAMVDFTSFTSLTDALGGVEMTTESGTAHYNGEEALRFVRERYNLPRGDFDRQRRQQLWMRSIMKGVFNKDVLSSPTKLYSLIDVVASNSAVDEEFTISEMRNLALSMTGIKPDQVHFLTIPFSGTGMVGDQSVVFLNESAYPQLCEAWREDRVSKYLQDNWEIETLESRPVY